MKSLKNCLKFIGDWVWVLQAFFRGAVLRQKAYLPKSSDDGMHLTIEFSPEVSIERISRLTRMWGIRPITDQELMKLLTNHDFMAKFQFGEYIIMDSSERNLRTCSFTKLSW